MALKANGDIKNLADCVQTLKINEDKPLEVVITNGSAPTDDIDDVAIRKEWGFSLPELYKIVVKFYKGEQ